MGVATPTNTIGVMVGVGVPKLPDGETTIENDLRLVYVIPLSLVVANRVIVTVVGEDTALLRTSMHHLAMPKNELTNCEFEPVPLTLHTFEESSE